jgi:hypothetical protein
MRAAFADVMTIAFWYAAFNRNVREPRQRGSVLVTRKLTTSYSNATRRSHLESAMSLGLDRTADHVVMAGS